MRANRFNGSGSIEPLFSCPRPFDIRSGMMQPVHAHGDLGRDQGSNREAEEFPGSSLGKSND